MWVEYVPTCQVSPGLMAEGRLGDEREKAKVGGFWGAGKSSGNADRKESNTGSRIAQTHSRG